MKENIHSCSESGGAQNVTKYKGIYVCGKFGMRWRECIEYLFAV
jgi:hypothetical protein